MEENILCRYKKYTSQYGHCWVQAPPLYRSWLKNRERYSDAAWLARRRMARWQSCFSWNCRHRGRSCLDGYFSNFWASINELLCQEDGGRLIRVFSISCASYDSHYLWSSRSGFPIVHSVHHHPLSPTDLAKARQLQRSVARDVVDNHQIAPTLHHHDGAWCQTSQDGITPRLKKLAYPC